MAAGGWIKWEKGLPRKREVVMMAARLNQPRQLIACACMEFWEWADSETIDGRVAGVTGQFIDALVAMPGFAGALEEVGWLRAKNNGVIIPNWERHNSESAKKRAKNTKLVNRLRAGGGGSKRACIPAKVKKIVWVRDGGKCRYCGWDCSLKSPPYGDMSGVTKSLDHVKPVSMGGDNSVGNIVVCCSKCNTSKGDRTPEAWGRLLLPIPISSHCEVTQSSENKLTRLEKIKEEEKQQQQEPAAALPGAAAAGFDSDTESRRAILAEAGIGEPTISELAGIAALTEPVLRQEISTARSQGKHNGAIVLNLRARALAESQKAQRTEQAKARQAATAERERQEREAEAAVRQAAEARYEQLTPEELAAHHTAIHAGMSDKAQALLKPESRVMRATVIGRLIAQGVTA